MRQLWLVGTVIVQSFTSCCSSLSEFPSLTAWRPFNSRMTQMAERTLAFLFLSLFRVEESSNWLLRRGIGQWVCCRHILLCSLSLAVQRRTITPLVPHGGQREACSETHLGPLRGQTPEPGMLQFTLEGMAVGLASEKRKVFRFIEWGLKMIHSLHVYT